MEMDDSELHRRAILKPGERKLILRAKFQNMGEGGKQIQRDL